MTDADLTFNSAVAAHVVATADRCGIFELINEQGVVEKSYFKEVLTNHGALDIIFDVLMNLGVITESCGKIFPGPRFLDYFRRKSLYTWLFHGSSSVLCAAPQFVRNGEQTKAARDSGLIGQSMQELGQIEIDAAIEDLGIWSEVSCLMDLGCGDGARLASLCGANNLVGIGVDIARSPNWQAQLDRAGREGTELKFFQGNANNLDFISLPSCEVDCLMLALMAHDMLPKENAIATMSSWKRKFQSLKYVIICETFFSEDRLNILRSPAPGIGYEFLHALLEIPLLNRNDWKSTIESAGFVVAKETPLCVPGNTSVFLCVVR